MFFIIYRNGMVKYVSDPVEAQKLYNRTSVLVESFGWGFAAGHYAATKEDRFKRWLALPVVNDAGR